MRWEVQLYDRSRMGWTYFLTIDNENIKSVEQVQNLVLNRHTVYVGRYQALLLPDGPTGFEIKSEPRYFVEVPR